MGNAHCSTRSDAELVAAVRSGDVTSFAELYRLHADAVRRVAYRRIGNTDAAADVVQDTFAQALQHLPELRKPDRFRSWLLAIADHAATDQLRARRSLDPLDESYEELVTATGPGPESLAELKELAEMVEGYVAGLSQRDATAVAMVAHLGFSITQVADALGVTAGAAKVIVHRARRRLRHALTLEILVRQPRLACGELRVLLETDLLAAHRHTKACEACFQNAGAEVLPFQMVATHSDPSCDQSRGRR